MEEYKLSFKEVHILFQLLTKPSDVTSAEKVAVYHANRPRLRDMEVDRGPLLSSPLLSSPLLSSPLLSSH